MIYSKRVVSEDTFAARLVRPDNEGRLRQWDDERSANAGSPPARNLLGIDGSKGMAHWEQVINEMELPELQEEVDPRALEEILQSEDVWGEFERRSADAWKRVFRPLFPAIDDDIL